MDYMHIASSVNNEYQFYKRDKGYYFANECFRGYIGVFDTLEQAIAFVQHDIEFRACYDNFLNG